MSTLLVRVAAAGLAALALACSSTRDGDGDGVGDDADGSATGASDPSVGETGADGAPTSADESHGTDDGSTSTPADGTGPGPEADLSYLEITPFETVLEIDLDTPAMQAFTLVGHYTDGATWDLTDEADEWTTSNPLVGTLEGAILQIPAFASATFESTIVSATYGGMQAQAQLTVAVYDQSSAQPDFFFVLPHEDPSGPQSKPLTFTTDVKSIDVFFSVDTTGSMGGPISNLQSSLQNTVIPGIAAAVPDAWFGAGIFEDFPWGNFGWSTCTADGGGATSDQPFELLGAMTDQVDDVQAAVDDMSNASGYPVGCGGDGPESNIEALYQIATGEGLASPGTTSVPPNNAGIGGVGFREDSLPVIVSVTDAVSHENAADSCALPDYDDDPGTALVAHNRDEMYAALADICARIVPVAVNSSSFGCTAYSDGREFAETTGAVIPPQAWDLALGGRPPGCAPGACCTGANGNGVAPNPEGLCPLVYSVGSSGTGLGQSIVDGIVQMAAYSKFDVGAAKSGGSTDEDGVALPAGTTTADFITAITPFDFGPVPLPGVPDPVMTATTFEGVIPNTDVTFTIEAFNDFVPQTAEPRLFVAHISVVADSCYSLDERDVFILVPPAPLEPPG